MANRIWNYGGVNTLWSNALNWAGTIEGIPSIAGVPGDGDFVYLTGSTCPTTGPGALLTLSGFSTYYMVSPNALTGAVSTNIDIYSASVTTDTLFYLGNAGSHAVMTWQGANMDLRYGVGRVESYNSAITLNGTSIGSMGLFHCLGMEVVLTGFVSMGPSDFRSDASLLRLDDCNILASRNRYYGGVACNNAYFSNREHYHYGYTLVYPAVGNTCTFEGNHWVHGYIDFQSCLGTIAINNNARLYLSSKDSYILANDTLDVLGTSPTISYALDIAGGHL